MTNSGFAESSAKMGKMIGEAALNAAKKQRKS
jgi:hypothetical protein